MRAIGRLIVAMSLLAMPASASVASENVNGGICAVRVDVSIPGGMGFLGVGDDTPAFTLSITSGDLDPGPDVVPCIYSGDLGVRTTTFESIDPDTDAGYTMTCDLVDVEGTLTQRWGPDATPQDQVDASFRLTGSWGIWNLTTSNGGSPPTFASTTTLKFRDHSDIALAEDECENSDVTLLRLKGLQIFEDPKV